MRPKFELGECVLIVSPSAHSPEDIVEEVLARGNVDGSDGWGYVTVNQPDKSMRYYESSLRKKHTPGEMTFDNLMASLSSPKPLTHQPK